jgi:DNA-binding MarR family transcriptional regulator
VDEAIDTPALRVLRHIAKNGSINMTRFTQESGHTPPHAKKLRERMEKSGYITVQKPKLIGVDKMIDATPEGREIGELSSKQEALAERANRRRA